MTILSSPHFPLRSQSNRYSNAEPHAKPQYFKRHRPAMVLPQNPPKASALNECKPQALHEFSTATPAAE